MPHYFYNQTFIKILCDNTQSNFAPLLLSDLLVKQKVSLYFIFPILKVSIYTLGSPTPRNSPRGSGRQQDHRGPLNVSLPPSAHSTLTRHQISQVLPSLHAPPPPVPPPVPRSVSYEPRWVFPVLKKSGDLGVRLVGGNAVGIFIHSVDPDSAAFHEGLRQADQILEYNGIDLRQATAEQAAYELAKPAEKVTILVQYNPGSEYFFSRFFSVSFTLREK